MDVWKISETTARKLSREPDVKRHIHFDVATQAYLITAATRDFLGLQNDAQRFTPEPGVVDGVNARMIRAWAAAVHDPLPEEVAREARLLLYTQRDLLIEYMGRGRVSNEAFLPAELLKPAAAQKKPARGKRKVTSGK